MKSFARVSSLSLSLFAALALTLSGAARAEIVGSEGDSSPLSKIENADLICKDGGGLYAFDTKGKRVWQGDPGMDEGIELKVSSFRTLKCPGCFDVEAKLDFLGQSQELKLTLRGVTASFSKSTLKVEAKQEDGKMEELFKFNCERPAAKQ